MVALTSDPATRKLYEKAYVDGSVLVTLQIVTPAAPSNIKGSAALRLGCEIGRLSQRDARMIRTVFPLVLKLSLFLVTAIATHLTMSLGQTLIHYAVAHHPRGGRIFRSHINFHHTHDSDHHLVSATYLGDEGNTTPFFFIPIFLVGGFAYWLLPLRLFVVMAVACAASFYAHVFFDKEYHSKRSRLQRLHGSDENRSCISFITGTRIIISR